MPDQFTVTTSQGWFGRIGSSFSGAVLGLIMFAASFVLIWWNEGRAVDVARALEEAGGAVVSVASDKVDPANDSKLIHVTGKADADEPVADAEFGVETNALRLERTVEMYQWHEKRDSKTRNKLGGGTETVTTYTYRKDWSSSFIDSSGFHERGQAEHQNPRDKFVVKSRTVAAPMVTLGAFQLSPPLVQQIPTNESLPVTSENLAKLGSAWKDKLTIAAEGRYFVGKDAANPEVGDLRIAFAVARPQPVSVIAQQHRDTFVAFQPKSAATTIELLHTGTHSAEAMVQAELSANARLTWILRLVAYVVMSLGICFVLSPLRVLADVIPFLGSLVGFALLAFSCLVAATLTLITIAISWIAHRPLLAYTLLGAAAVGVIGMIVMAKRRR